MTVKFRRTSPALAKGHERRRVMIASGRAEMLKLQKLNAMSTVWTTYAGKRVLGIVVSRICGEKLRVGIVGLFGQYVKITRNISDVQRA